MSNSCDPMSRLRGSAVHGVLQARRLEWVATSSSRASSGPRDRTQTSRIAGRCFYRLSYKESPKRLGAMSIQGPPGASYSPLPLIRMPPRWQKMTSITEMSFLIDSDRLNHHVCQSRRALKPCWCLQGKWGRGRLSTWIWRDPPPGSPLKGNWAPGETPWTLNASELVPRMRLSWPLLLGLDHHPASALVTNGKGKCAVRVGFLTIVTPELWAVGVVSP